MRAAGDPAPPRDAEDGVDVTLIRWMLSRSPEERLAVLQGFVDSVAELTHDPRVVGVQVGTDGKPRMFFGVVLPP